jgi:hypothetical protein
MCIQFGCKRRHPKERKLPCKYGINCMNSACNFAHPTSDGKSRLISVGHCLFDVDCVNSNCHYLHPLRDYLRELPENINIELGYSRREFMKELDAYFLGVLRKHVESHLKLREEMASLTKELLIR